VELPETIEQGVARLEADGFVAYPTETVWGLAAPANRSDAVARLIEWKGRDFDTPMSVLVASVDEASQIGCRLDGSARDLAAAFWPGPLTLVLPCDGRFAPGVARSDGALGLRCSPHPVARALAIAARDAGLAPLTSTSFNRTGESPAVDLDSARALAAGGHALDLASPEIVFVAGEDAGSGGPSSVVDCTGPRPKILRVGAIDRASLENAKPDDPRRS
jgi:L-threonylcarbamoyladenylate synthase